MCIRDSNISIESLIQKDLHDGQVPVVIVTDSVIEKSMNAAIVELESLDQVEDSVTRIRVESF